ncbi:MAG: 16S rRNA (cytosine(1402)-N(4))-methyltransferase RsmH [Aeriscardovia sp.]|nr:16S rRNA (cytosine(1402)-N(4))-methyltransferase RsmH [Aeriscardovia sp.]
MKQKNSAPHRHQIQEFAPGTINSADTITTDDAQNIHQPVLLQQCIDLMLPVLQKDNAIIVDGTLGLAGHAQAFLHAASSFHLIGIDQDEEALALATQRLDEFHDRFTPVHSSFGHFTQVIRNLGYQKVDAVFLDLGLSSLQIDEKDRGFSYLIDEPLDMRMDTSKVTTAADILLTYSEKDLVRIFRDYGQERWAQKIAHAIVTDRVTQPFTTTTQLAHLVDHVIPRKNRPAGNPAKRVFQALRIEVNGELDQLRSVLPQIALHLNVGGRIVIESYHSLEDTIVKHFFTSGSRVDVPRGIPQIPSELQPYFKDITHGALKADQNEVDTNPRSRSVRLRAIELVKEIPLKERNKMKQSLHAEGMVE